MNTLLGFGVLILVIINFSIYHKFVTSFYSDFVGGCATEIFWIAIATAFEIAIFRGVILKILSALGSVFGFVGKLILFVVIAAIVIFVAWKIVQIVKSKTDIDREVEKSVNPVQNNPNAFEKNVSDMKVSICTSCGKTIKKNSNFCQFCGRKIENNINL